MPRTRTLPCVLLAAVTFAGACGGDDGGDSAGGGGGSAGGGGGEGAAADLPPCPVDALDEAAADGPVTIDFWHAMGGAELETAMTSLTEEYNASQDRVQVQLLNQQSYEENFESFRSATPADRPALVQLPEYYVQTMADSGTTLPAQACVDASALDLEPLVERAVDYYTIDGVLQSMPFNVSNQVLYYRRDMFEAAGLDPDSPPASFEELRAASQAIVDSGAATYGIALETGFDSGGGWGVELWFSAAGELYADAENGREGRASEVLFDGELGVEIFSFLQGMVDDGLAVNVGENTAGTDGLLKLADPAEPAAMTLYTSAAISSVIAALGGGLVPGLGADDVGVGPLPTPEGTGGVTVGGASLWLTEDQPDERVAAAWDFVSFLVSAESQSTWSVGTGYVPVNEEAVALAPLSDTLAADPRFQVAYDQLLAGEDDAAGAGPVTGPLRQVRGEVAAALQAVLDGADPAEALAAAAEGSDALIADYAQRTGTGG